MLQKIVALSLKGIKELKKKVLAPLDYVVTYIVLYANGACFKTFQSYGVPSINISLSGKLIIGRNFRMINREWANPIGRFNRCSIIVGSKGYLKIGNNVGMSSVAIVCQSKIEIEDDVKLGGNVVIYDTDFHSLDTITRKIGGIGDFPKTAPVLIKKNAFIGAHTTILKGTVIGENSIIGACSVVTRSVPDNEIWGGNPAKFIRYIDNIEI